MTRTLPAEYRYEHYDPCDDDDGNDLNQYGEELTDDEQFSSDALADWESEDRYGEDEDMR